MTIARAILHQFEFVTRHFNGRAQIAVTISPGTRTVHFADNQHAMTFGQVLAGNLGLPSPKADVKPGCFFLGLPFGVGPTAVDGEAEIRDGDTRSSVVE